MAEPAFKLPDDTEPDFQPYLTDIGGAGKNVRRVAPWSNLQDLKKAESNPEGVNDDSISDQEANGSNIIQAPWANNVSGQNKSSEKAGGKFSFIKKKGPLTAIILTLVGGGIGIGALLSPGLLLVQMKEAFIGELSNADPALNLRTRRMIAQKFNTTRNSFATSSDGKCNIRCKFGSMNDTMKKNFEAKGFKIDADEGTGIAKGRWILKSMEFPDGIKVASGDEFSSAMKDTSRASSFKKVFNSKTAYFLNSKFGTILKEKFGINKASKLTTKLKEKAADKVTSIKDKIKASMRETLGLAPIDVDAPTLTAREKLAASGKFKGVLAKVDELNTKYGSASAKMNNVLSGLCATYNVAKGITYTAKVAKIAAFVSFAMVFLNAADQIKAGDADPDVISALGDQLTQVDADGKSATDSLGYQIGALGSTNSGTEIDKTYSATIGTTAVVGILAGILTFLNSTGRTAMTTARTACRASGNQAVAVATTCPEEIIAALATGFETGGIGAIGSAVVCAGKMLITSLAIGAAISSVLSNIIPAIAENEVPSLDGDTIGSAAGDSIYTGTAQLLGGASASYGLKAGTVSEIKQYAINTAGIQQQEIAIASYEAKNTPFDIYNQYSFLGSIARKLGISSLYNSSFLSNLSSVISIIPKSFAALTNSVGAEADSKASRYDNKCSDGGLELIGVGADALCNPSYVMSENELNADMNEVIDYMVGSKDIDEATGEAMPDSNYKLYLDNCANRTDPWGETSAPVEDADYEWKVGIKCTEDSTELSNFRTYTMDMAISNTLDE